MIREQEQPSHLTIVSSHATEKQEAVPEAIVLRPETQTALAEILDRQDNPKQQSAEDVVADAIEIYNVLTRHLTQKDSKVILHTVGKSLKTLNIPNFGGQKPVYQREIRPPKMTW